MNLPFPQRTAGGALVRCVPVLRTLALAGLAALLTGLAAALSGCGGGDAGTGAMPVALPANTAPQASFTTPAGAAAGDALALDASASSDADGDTLSYSWDFGDGTHGGGAQLAHTYPGAGTFTVTLTVSDGRGGSATTSHDVTISAPPPLQAPAASEALATDSAGALQGVAVTVLETGATATTGGDGKANITIATGAALTVKFSKPGYADQFKRVQLHGGATGALVVAHMLAREGALTLADAAAGGTLAGKHGATLMVPAGALVDTAGNAVSGAVQVAMTPVDVAADVRDFPGLFQGLRASGARGLIESYGTVEYVLTKNGAPLQVAPGRTVTIEIPIYTALHRDGSAVAAGQTIPLWSLDERTATWVQEGTGTVVSSAASPSGFALRAQVSHLSWWNCDQWLGSIPDGSYNPKVKCCIRDTPNGPCKENSGDVCEHTGSGPTSSGPGGNGARDALQRALRERPAQSVGSQRVPAVAAFATAPAISGAVLPMPANMDITLESSARNGTYRGITVLRGGAGVSEDVTVSLLPLAGGGNDEPITLPWSQNYSMQANGEVDRYKLVMPQGPGFEVFVSRAGSTLGGTLKVTRPDGSVVATSNFANNPGYITEASVTTAGDYTIEVTAGSGAPGAYKLEAASFGTCANVEALTLPVVDHLVTLAPNQMRCLEVTLAVDEAIRIDGIRAHNQVAGSLSLTSADGLQQLASVAYPMGGRIFIGAPTAGTYRLRMTNTTTNTGKLEFSAAKPVAQVLTVPQSVTLTMASGAEPQFFVLKPPTGGLYHVALTATNLVAGVQVDPAGTSFVTGCGSGCSGLNISSDARAVRSTGPGLPVVTLFRNTGSGGTGDTVTLAAGVPTPIARDVDIDGSAGSGLRVHTLDANAGEEVAFQLASAKAVTERAQVDIHQPTGSSIGSSIGGGSRAIALPETGLYSVVVKRGSGAGAFGAYTMRINTPPPAQPLALTSPMTTLPFDLPLGQVLRYNVDLAQGELVGLTMATPTMFADATIDNVVAVSASGLGNGPFAASTPPAFVRTGGTRLLTLRSSVADLELARGSGTLQVHKPTPANAPINVPQTGTVALGEWTTYRYTVPAAGRYLLRLVSTAPAPYTIYGTVWASSSPISNYGGEFSSTAHPGFNAFEGLGALPAGSYTVSVLKGNDGVPSASYAVSLVDLEAPGPLTVNGAALAGNVDTDGERDYASFHATAGQAYTVRTTATFAGVVRVRKLAQSGNWTERSDGFAHLAGTPVALGAGVESVLSFTIPSAAPFGSGTYIVEVMGDAGSTGGYTVQLSSP